MVMIKKRRENVRGETLCVRSRKLWALFFGLMLAPVWNQQGARAEDKGFHPVSVNLLGFSTDRDTVDIEIVGSTSLVPHQHQLEPDRVLRLRLERAYITSFLTQAAPGFSILDISIDQPTTLPQALIAAVSRQGRFHRDIEGIPALEPDEAIRRHVVLAIRSDLPNGSFSNYAKGAAECVQQTGSNDLQELKLLPSFGAKACARPIQRDGRKWLARREGANPAVIECHGGGGRVTGCSTSFDYQKFAVGLRFHESLLPKWREVIAFAEAFLSSKQVNR
jgi:hypothetical protein